MGRCHSILSRDRRAHLSNIISEERSHLSTTLFLFTVTHPSRWLSILSAPKSMCRTLLFPCYPVLVDSLPPHLRSLTSFPLAVLLHLSFSFFLSIAIALSFFFHLVLSRCFYEIPAISSGGIPPPPFSLDSSWPPRRRIHCFGFVRLCFAPSLSLFFLSSLQETRALVVRRYHSDDGVLALPMDGGANNWRLPILSLPLSLPLSRFWIVSAARSLNVCFVFCSLVSVG